MISKSNTSQTCQQATWCCFNTHPRPGQASPAQAAQRALAQQQGPPPYPGPGLPGLGLPGPGLSGPGSAAGASAPPRAWLISRLCFRGGDLQLHLGPRSQGTTASLSQDLLSMATRESRICVGRWPFAMVPVCTAGGQCQRRDTAGAVCAGGDPAPDPVRPAA